MFSRSALAVFAVIVAEFFAASWVVGQIGFGATLLALVALAFLGIAVARWNSAGLVQTTLESAMNPSGDATTSMTRRTLGLFAGFLIGFPGFCSSLVGLLLLFGPVRRFVEPRLVAKASAITMPFGNRPGFRGSWSRGTVIDVDLVDDDLNADGSRADNPGGDHTDVPRSARPEIG